MCRFRIEFSKGDAARFLSHLDLMATIEYALRRARFPVELSEGFNPRPRFSLAAPLPVGYIGEREILELALREALAAENVGTRLQSALPAGLSILSVSEIPSGQKAAASRVRGATYRVEIGTPFGDIQDRIAALLDRPSIDVEELREQTMRWRDIRPLILSLAPAGPLALRLAVCLGAEGTVRPEQILQLLAIPATGARIIRERIELRD
jgi:radical SAM-linked protein